MRAITTALCAAGLALAAGCQTTAGFPDAALASWRGEPVGRVIAALGPPTTAGEAAGLQAFTWRFERVFPPTGEMSYCTVSVAAQAGIVTGGRYYGDSCIFTNPKAGIY